MTANEKRMAVAEKYKTILGRNKYSQPKRDYCFKKYKDGKYYSDCSSSISYCYKEAGLGFGILNTVGMYQSKKMADVPVVIKNGQIQNSEVLRVGDMLLFAGSDSGRSYAGYVGHVEMVYAINGTKVTLCGHGSGTPSLKDMHTYCKSRYNAKSSTKLGHKGLIRVRRFIQDDASASEPSSPVFSDKVTITGNSVNIRKGAGTNFGVFKVARKGDSFERLNTSGWTCVLYKTQSCWISAKYIDALGKCTGNSVNIRSGAGTAFASVGIVHKGDKLEIVKTDSWIPIVINGSVYWVSAKYAE